MTCLLYTSEGYRNDEFKAIHIIADAVVLPDMTAYTLLFQNAVLESVSYTHLDVYKRQGQYVITVKGEDYDAETNPEAMSVYTIQYQKAAPTLTSLNVAGHESVSYTHLDPIFAHA